MITSRAVTPQCSSITVLPVSIAITCGRQPIGAGGACRKIVAVETVNRIPVDTTCVAARNILGPEVHSPHSVIGSSARLYLRLYISNRIANQTAWVASA